MKVRGKKKFDNQTAADKTMNERGGEAVGVGNSLSRQRARAVAQ